jgi:YidC/Oxa1 family membrane protein insertase
MYSLDLTRLAASGKATALNRSRVTLKPRSRVVSSLRSSNSRSSASLTSSLPIGYGVVSISKRYVARSPLVSSLGGIRLYSTPSPVDEGAKATADSFVTSAINNPTSVVDTASWLAQNEGFTHLSHPVSWTSVWDPIYWFLQGNLELVHTVTGLPWWGAILTMAALSRIATFPFQVKQTRLTTITQKIQPEIEAIRKKYMYASGAANKTGKRDMEVTVRMSAETREVMSKHGVGPLTALKYALPQGIIMIGGFFVLRYIAETPQTFLHQFWVNGGDFWFQNLTLADPTFILPLMSAFSTCALIAITPMPNMSKKVVIGLSAAVAALSFYITCGFPAAIHLYWAGSSTFTFLSTLLLKTTAVRAMFGIPPLDPSSVKLPQVELFDTPLAQRRTTKDIVIEKLLEENSAHVDAPSTNDYLLKTKEGGRERSRNEFQPKHAHSKKTISK